MHTKPSNTILGVLFTFAGLGGIIGPWLIRRFRELKFGHGYIDERTGVLGATYFDKQHTPTMGGLVIIFATLVPTLLWARVGNRMVVVAMLATLWMGAIGFLDDYLKVVQGKSRGLVARWKLAGQVGFGLALGLYLIFWPVVPTTVMPASGRIAAAGASCLSDLFSAAFCGLSRSAERSAMSVGPSSSSSWLRPSSNSSEIAERPRQFPDVDAHPAGVLGAEPADRARVDADHRDVMG